MSWQTPEQFSNSNRRYHRRVYPQIALWGAIFLFIGGLVLFSCGSDAINKFTGGSSQPPPGSMYEDPNAAAKLQAGNQPIIGQQPGGNGMMYVNPQGEISTIAPTLIPTGVPAVQGASEDQIACYVSGYEPAIGKIQLPDGRYGVLKNPTYAANPPAFAVYGSNTMYSYAETGGACPESIY